MTTVCKYLPLVWCMVFSLMYKSYSVKKLIILLILIASRFL